MSILCIHAAAFRPVLTPLCLLSWQPCPAAQAGFRALAGRRLRMALPHADAMEGLESELFH